MELEEPDNSLLDIIKDLQDKDNEKDFDERQGARIQGSQVAVSQVGPFTAPANVKRHPTR